MSKRIYGGLSVLIILIIGGAIFLVIKDQAEIRELKRQLAEDEQGHSHADGTFHHGPSDEDESSTDVSNDDVRPAKIAKSGDVPKISPDPVSKEEPHKPKLKKLYTGPLTFHEELLKTNPVKALRLQQEERGHWSATWIPPFPSDDTEAQEFARVVYLRKYYIQTYGDLLETPEYGKETKAFYKALTISKQMFDSIMSYPYGARKSDLMKLTWPSLSDTVGVSYSDGTVNPNPSEYFGDPKVRAFAKQAGTWAY